MGYIVTVFCLLKNKRTEYINVFHIMYTKFTQIQQIIVVFKITNYCKYSSIKISNNVTCFKSVDNTKLTILKAH